MKKIKDVGLGVHDDIKTGVIGGRGVFGVVVNSGIMR